MNPLQPLRTRALAVVLPFAAALPGCAVVSVAGAAAGAAVSVGSAAVSVGSSIVGSTVQVAGKVVEKTIDIAVPGSPAPAR